MTGDVGVQRILFFYNYSFIIISLPAVGSRGSSASAHSLLSVGETLNKDFFIIANYKTIITLCVTNVQRKKS